jgi:hypothetical protein
MARRPQVDEAYKSRCTKQRKHPKTRLRLPDLEFSKTAVLNSLTSADGLENSSQTTSDHDEDSVPTERAVIENRMMRVRTENQVVSQPAASEIFSRVVDNVAGADHSRRVHIPRAAHGVTSAPNDLAIWTAKVPTLPRVPGE